MSEEQADWILEQLKEAGFETAREKEARPGKKKRRTPSDKMLRDSIITAGLLVVFGVGLALLAQWQANTITPPTPMPRFGTPARVQTAAPAPAKKAPVQNQIVYHADASGHFYIDGFVNGAAVRFLVDTGATFVSLSPQDAAAAGIDRASLSFSETMNTANGTTHAARTTLRAVRIDQLEVEDVPAVVMEQPMATSLLGMSFLGRLEGYTVSNGVLTINW